MRSLGLTRIPFRHVTTIVTVTFVVSIVLSGGLHPEVHGLSTPSPSLVCSGVLPARATVVGEYLNLTILVDHARGEAYYSPASFTVPSRTLILVTITNYDPGNSTVPLPDSQVCGAVNGTEVANGVVVSQLPPAGTSHTFTVTSGPYQGFNVPVPPASVRSPSTATFGAYFATSGTYSWQCEAGDAANPGPTSGSLTVA